MTAIQSRRHSSPHLHQVLKSNRCCKAKKTINFHALEISLNACHFLAQNSTKCNKIYGNWFCSHSPPSLLAFGSVEAAIEHVFRKIACSIKPQCSSFVHFLSFYSTQKKNERNDIQRDSIRRGLNGFYHALDVQTGYNLSQRTTEEIINFHSVPDKMCHPN